ncbi:hypothetical protein A3C23_04465 [Candidatus Roizmanbacteria bacterium RIFCSPHIGHO2_02_FULL_37_13b]|uniref:Glycosyltransferase RgtA/B/C/D-like domain-containing protein n=1 Tax=Candidatus Roizmanbacteria bacterium RIFCSPLOWO2_02_FULL_36_11 TaxID=1802071 RepID=A0A1F7JH70_9BACT|nr:MAG: hypothetical protein A3C23_04465 [Candidatus Roizmanbacteria bacterium RIFCSPHIGHO2_02_FULL_37_13b]OGK54961.1 MAG: hypothetical protein A3H78_00610 [Candidatus Roizmanbacteria bacterium RIFCSPLOWO2_02_FULL_36_11]
MKHNLIVILIIFVAVLLRIINLNWDLDQHLHPDERFLTMTVNKITIPNNLADYLNPNKSSLNPYNNETLFYVYGTLPLTLAKIVAVKLNMDNYNDFTILGRFLSGLFDIGVLIFLYKIAQLFEKKYRFDKKIKLLVIFFYSITVLAIQHSHFYVVDNFLNFFFISGLYFITKFRYKRKLINLILSACLFGFALGSKLSALYTLPLFIFFIFQGRKTTKPILKLIISMGIFFLIGYLSLRVADPKFFADNNFLNFKINPIFIENIKSLDVQYSNGSWFPPAIQWISKPKILFAGYNIIFFGLGLPYGILSLLGMYYLFQKYKKIEFRFLIVWAIVFFLYQSMQFISTMRYFIFLYPFLAFFAAFGYQQTIQMTNNRKHRYWIGFIIIVLVLIWPVSFMSVYLKDNSRIAASKWIYQNIPENSYLAEEQWDDWLPIYVKGVVSRNYRGEQIPITGPDTEEKWQILHEKLAQADYYITTSNRAYGSMMPLPQMFPKTAQFYEELFDGTGNFKKIIEFHSYPSINLPFLNLEFNDQKADEAFNVYDHPRVIIFKKIK